MLFRSDNVDLTNIEITNDSPSLHGPAVLSLLAGKEIGIIPDSKVYFLGNVGGGNNEYEAIAFEKIVELNKTLPESKKIRIVGMSHGADDALDPTNAQHLREAQEKARESGIIVVDVSCGMATAGVKGFQNRDSYQNYELTNWQKSGSVIDRLIVPADNRTTAVGYLNDVSHYAYWSEGGFSWGVPYIVGVITMGLQIDPDLTEEEAFKYLHESAHDHLGGDFINPQGFIQKVKENCDNPKIIGDYRYFLYNKNETSAEDLAAINNYMSKFKDDTVNVLKEISEYSSAIDIYKMLEEDAKSRSGTLKGVQILGIESAVPAFDVHFKIQMQDAIDDSGNFKTDFFYSNFDSDSQALKTDFSIYKAFAEELNVSFVSQWPVTRLALSKGEFSDYMNKADAYAKAVEKRKFGDFVNFSNPIFASANHSDDFSFFMKNRLDKEFNILDADEYRLYGNLQGNYPVQTEVLGDFTKENIAKENKQGIREFIINSHGQWNNIDQCIYESSEPSSEMRISFLNKETINMVLSENYYDLDLWTCLNGYNLDDQNLVYEAMANGKCVSAMAASSVISNNGVHNDVSYDNLKKNNFYYFYLDYLYNRADDKKRSESFQIAQQSYATEILKNTDMLGDGNYQFNLHNVLAYHYFGLLEYWEVEGKENFNPNFGNDPEDDPEEPSFDGNIQFTSNYYDNGFKVNNFSARRSGDLVHFTLNYESNRDCGYSFFNPPDGNVLMKSYYNGIKQDQNTTEFDLTQAEFKKILSVNSITLRIGFDEKASWIFFNTDQLKALDKELDTGINCFYRTHVENVGWQDWKSNGKMSGTSGQGLRLEGIEIKTESLNYDLGVEYATHIQNIGWQEKQSNGSMSGTSGEGLRLEAIKINLTGADADKFDIYYRVHAENIGWLDWAKNNQEAGTAGFGYRLEGIEIQVLPEGAAAPGKMVEPFIKK